MKKIFTPFIFTIVLIMAIGSIDGNAQVSNDASIININTPACTPVLSIKLANSGSNNINPVKIGWSINGALQTPNTYSQIIQPGNNVTIMLSPNYNFVNGQTYALKVFTYAPNNTVDGNKTNDTAKLTFKYIVKRPSGAAFKKGTPFITPNPNTTGTQNDPDLVAANGQLIYELSPPTGYTNSGYGTTWMAMTPVVKSYKNYPLDSKYWAYTAPSGSSPGKLTFVPDKGIQDTCIIVTLLIKDLGPYFGDSTISRYICVVPRPNSNFSVDELICENDTVIFTNTSSISSGALSNKWNFGTGNPADTANTKDAKFKFPTYGTYYVKLTTTSATNITDSVTKPVIVNPQPDAGFTYTITGNTVDFKANQTGLVTYQWNFGDGGKAQTPNPRHQYSGTPSNYSVCLTVINSPMCDDESCKTISITGGIKNTMKQSGIMVYPNPNNGHFKVSIENPKSDIKINIYNVLGELILSRESKVSQSEYSIDLDGLRGLCVLKVNNGGFISTHLVSINK